MIRVAALYPNKPGSRFDMDYYLTRHVPWARAELEKAGMTAMEIDRGIAGMAPGAAAPFHVIALMTFRTLEDFQRALGEVAPKLMADMSNYTDVQLQVQVSERAE
jgi:uncharacterized protein (TIGR02118 family)